MIWKGCRRDQNPVVSDCFSLAAYDLRRVTFRARPNRYLAHVELAGKVVACHVPNPGRMTELMIPGAEGLAAAAAAPHRKTDYDLIALRTAGIWVYIDNRLGNRVLRWRLAHGGLPEWKDYDQVQPEVRFGDSRIDFQLTRGLEKGLLEMKSCTLVVDGEARFPDAPTGRGRRHLEELRAARAEGYRTGVLFLIQRRDARWFRPHDELDPAFGAALRQAVAEGVEVWAYTSELRDQAIWWGHPVEVRL